MSEALRHFMDRLVDYAGLFPPAALDMDAAVKEYAKHRGQPESWMLGRFIVPAGRLAELEDTASPLMVAESPWPLSVLLGDREDPTRSLEGVSGGSAAIARYESRLEGRSRVEVLEVPIPGALPAAGAPEFLEAFFAALERNNLMGREIFFEIPPASSPEDEGPILEALRRIAETHAGPDRSALRLGVKLRCGGVTPEAFPSVERVARILALARDLDLPFKGTAGLHHPVRFQATEPPVMMHGFLNVFGAGLLAHALGWEAARLAEVVGETDPRAFAFSEGGFRWRDHHVTWEDVRRLRQRFLCGFGSCSFAEPRDDLQSLGLL